MVTRTGINTVNFAETLILQGFLLFSIAKALPKYHLFPIFLSEIEVSLQQKQDQNFNFTKMVPNSLTKSGDPQK